MGYRIDFRVGGAVLEAIVSGRSGFASAIAVIDAWQLRSAQLQGTDP